MAQIFGEVSVQNGTLKIGAATPLSRMNGELNINSGATLDLNGSSIAAESIGSNNRQVTGTGGGVSFGGSITNTAMTTAVLGMASPCDSTYTGTLDGDLRWRKPAPVC